MNGKVIIAPYPAVCRISIAILSDWKGMMNELLFPLISIQQTLTQVRQRYPLDADGEDGNSTLHQMNTGR